MSTIYTVNGFEFDVDFYAGDRWAVIKEADHAAVESIVHGVLAGMTAADVVRAITAVDYPLSTEDAADFALTAIGDACTEAIAAAGHDTSALIVHVRLAD